MVMHTKFSRLVLLTPSLQKSLWLNAQSTLQLFNKHVEVFDGFPFILISGCYDGKLYKIRINGGIVVWEFTTGDMVKCTAVVHENKVIFGSYDKYVYAVNEVSERLFILAFVIIHQINNSWIPRSN